MCASDLDGEIPSNDGAMALSDAWIRERGRDLRDADVRPARHRDVAVAPGLGRDPFDRVVAVVDVRFAQVDEVPLALGGVPPADVLDHVRVTGDRRRERRTVRVHRELRRLVVRRPRHDRRHLAADVGPDDVRTQRRPVPRLHLDVAIDADRRITHGSRG